MKYYTLKPMSKSRGQLATTGEYKSLEEANKAAKEMMEIEDDVLEVTLMIVMIEDTCLTIRRKS